MFHVKNNWLLCFMLKIACCYVSDIGNCCVYILGQFGGIGASSHFPFPLYFTFPSASFSFALFMLWLCPFYGLSSSICCGFTSFYGEVLPFYFFAEFLQNFSVFLWHFWVSFCFVMPFRVFFSSYISLFMSFLVVIISHFCVFLTC